MQIAIDRCTAPRQGDGSAVVTIDDGDASTFPGLKTTQCRFHLQCCHHRGGIIEGISKGQSGKGGMNGALGSDPRIGAKTDLCNGERIAFKVEIVGQQITISDGAGARIFLDIIGVANRASRSIGPN